MTSSPDSGERETFGAVDYCIFIGLLAIHGLLGIYHALRMDRYKSAREFFSTNRSINPIPVALSVLVTTMTSITYLGYPAEAYLYGPTFWFMALNKPVVALVVARTFVPVFYRLQVKSIYDYLELRFGRVTRIFGAVLNFLFILMCTGIIIYAPALALTTVTGLDLTYSILFVGVTCTFYTTLGGVKAVMWTNLFQTMVMLTAFTSTLAVGAFTVGGMTSISAVMNPLRNTNFNFNPIPAARTSFFSCFIGGTFLGLSAVASNQQMIQRFLTCKTERQAKNAVWLGFSCIAIVEVIAVCTGVVMYVYYQGCDPYTSGKVDSAEQLMPYFTVDLFSEVYGLSGLFVFSIFSASLSAVSSQLNSLADMTGYGVVKQIWPETGGTLYTVIIKMFVTFYGLSTVGIAFLASCSRSLLQMTFSVIGITTGPLLGVLSLGILCPQASTNGAISGMTVAVLFGIWLQVGALVYPPIHPTLPLSTSMCYVDDVNFTEPLRIQPNYTTVAVTSNSPPPLNMTTDVRTAADGEYPLFASFYSISYLYYGFLTWSLTFLVGITVSHFCKSEDANERKDPDLVATICDTYSCCLPEGLTPKDQLQTDTRSEFKNNSADKTERFFVLERKEKRLVGDEHRIIEVIQPLAEQETEV